MASLIRIPRPLAKRTAPAEKTAQLLRPKAACSQPGFHSAASTPSDPNHTAAQGHRFGLIANPGQKPTPFHYRNGPHVVQQARGRVQPTMRMKGGVPLHDEAGLEREADIMGARAASEFRTGRAIHPALRAGLAPIFANPGKAAPFATGPSTPVQCQWSTDRYGRMLWNRKRVKDYAVPTTAAGHIVLGIKHPNSPYGHGTTRAFMGGLPTLPGGNFESKHRIRHPGHPDDGRPDASGITTVDSELDEELRRGYRRTGAPTDFPHVDDGTIYRFHHVPVASIPHPAALPTHDLAFHETARVMELNPSLIADHALDDHGIQDAILGQAGIDPATAHTTSLHEFRTGHTTGHLVSTIRSRGHQRRVQERGRRQADRASRLQDAAIRQPRHDELVAQLSPLQNSLREHEAARDRAAHAAAQHQQLASQLQEKHRYHLSIGEHQNASDALFRSFSAMSAAHTHRNLALEHHRTAEALRQQERPLLTELTEHRDALTQHQAAIQDHQTRLAELNTIMSASGYRPH